MKQKTLLATAVTAALALQAWSVAAQDANASQPPAQAASAQQSAKSLDTVTVTGSRIRSADVETAQPIVALDRKQIENSGYTTVDQLLQNIPAAQAGIGRATNNNSGSEAGSSTISLRYLGAQRTLVLVNGRRWSTQLDGTTDISSIPVSMIERIEVLKDGASTIYGSDAIAGVVNIITRDHFDGAEVHINYGKYGQGDGTSKTADFTVGTHNDNGSIIVNVQHTEADAVASRDRAISSVPYYRYPGVGLSSYADHGTYEDPATGNMVSLLGGTAHPFHSSQEGYNYNQNTDLLDSTKRDSIYTQAKYKFNDNVSFRSTVSYNQRTTDGSLAPTPLAVGPDLGTTSYLKDTVLSAQSYYNPTGEDLSVKRRMVEAGPRATDNQSQNLHLDFGLDGNFSLGDHLFNWDTTYSYDHLHADMVTDGEVNAANLRTGLGPSFLGANGVVQCGTPGNVISGCTPINLLSSKGGLTKDQLAYIIYNDHSSFDSTTHDFTANLTGNIVALPAGDLSFATGYEYRKLNGSFTPDSITAAGLSSGNRALPTSGGYDVNEGYLELSAPLLRDLPGAQELSFDTSGRYSDFNNFGHTTNFKYGLTWHPIQDLLVRGTVSSGFRAPTIEDLYQGNADDFGFYNDPCDTANGAAASNAKVAKNCTVGGVPVNYTQPNGYGAQTNQPFTQGGNAALRPESSRSKTVGLVYSPSFVEGLDLSLDWYSIKINNTIQRLSATDILDQCYRQSVQSYCDLITRSANGTITSLDEVVRNIGMVKTEGYDFSAHYRLPETSIGKFALSLDTNYVTKYDQSAITGQAPTGEVGYFDGTTPIWRVKSNAQLDWSKGPWSAMWRLRYTSGLNEQCVFSDHCNLPNHIDPVSGTPNPFNHVGATTYNDASIAYHLPWNGTISVGINNIFDRNPPILYTATSGVSFDASDYDLPGRYWFIDYRQRF